MKILHLSEISLLLLLLASSGCKPPMWRRAPTTELATLPATRAATPRPLATDSITENDPAPSARVIHPTLPASNLPPLLPPPLPHQVVTFQQMDGNRWIPGKGALPQTQPLNLPLAGPPGWILAAPLEDGTFWLAALEDGRVQPSRLQMPAFANSGRHSPTCRQACRLS